MKKIKQILALNIVLAGFFATDIAFANVMSKGRNWAAVRSATTVGKTEKMALTNCNEHAQNCQILMSECLP
jgi:hypothetical protein